MLIVDLLVSYPVSNIVVVDLEVVVALFVLTTVSNIVVVLKAVTVA